MLFLFFDQLFVLELDSLAFEFVLVADSVVGLFQHSQLILQTFYLLFDEFVVLICFFGVGCGLLDLFLQPLYLLAFMGVIGDAVHLFLYYLRLFLEFFEFFVEFEVGFFFFLQSLQFLFKFRYAFLLEGVTCVLLCLHVRFIYKIKESIFECYKTLSPDYLGVGVGRWILELSVFLFELCVFLLKVVVFLFEGV